MLSGFDLHPIATQRLTTSLLGHAVDRYAAFKADAHAAQRAARLARDGVAKGRLAGSRQGRRDGVVGRDADAPTVDRESDSCGHGCGSWQNHKRLGGGEKTGGQVRFDGNCCRAAEQRID